MKRLFRRIDPDMRARLRNLQDANEMARVWLRGRKNRRAAASFAGHPVVGRKTVTLHGADGRAAATVMLRDVYAVQRVMADNPPKSSGWFAPRAKLG